MLRIHRGVQSLIKEVAPLSFYVHCQAHRLNLVVVAVCTNVGRVMDMLHTIRSLHKFFSATIPAGQNWSGGPVLAAKSSPGDHFSAVSAESCPYGKEYHLVIPMYYDIHISVPSGI